MSTSYLTDINARSHRDDLNREAKAVRSARRARRVARSEQNEGQNDFGESHRHHHGRVYAAWNWLATAQL